MKVAFERVNPAQDRSFKIFTPRLNDFYYWHFHPEYEIVYIDGADGTRHVGDHLARFEGGDLVMIGPNVPHLNFDYGIQGPYEKIVVQLRESFMDQVMGQVPELEEIKDLFERARHGISFGAATRSAVGAQLRALTGMDRFDQLLGMLRVFQQLAGATDYLLLNARPIDNHYNLKEQQRIRAVNRFIDENFHRPISVEEVAAITHLTVPSFCRYFRQMTKLTFTDFLNQYRVNQAKKLLMQDRSVADACFETGFASLSYFNRIFRKFAHMNPSEFKRQYTRR